MDAQDQTYIPLEFVPLSPATPLIIRRHLVSFPYAEANIIGPITFSEAKRGGWLSRDSGTIMVFLSRAADDAPVTIRDGASPAIVSAANAVMEQGYSWIKSPFDLTHTRASIRRDRERTEEIRKQQARQARAEAAGGITIARSADGSWCTVTFAEKPSREILDALKASGYRFGAGSWSGYLNALPAEVAELEGAR